MALPGGFPPLRVPKVGDPLDRSQKSVVAVAFAAVMIIVPPFVSSSYIFITTQGFLTAVAAMGLAIIIGWAGQMTLAGAALMGTATYMTGYLMRAPTVDPLTLEESSGTFNGWPFIFAAIIGVLMAAAFSGFVAVPTARFSPVYVLVLTMGLQITLERTLFSQPWLVGGFGADIKINRPELFGFNFGSDLRYFYLCFFVMVLAGFFVHSLRRSRHGRAINLVRTDRRAAASVGISPSWYRVIAFTVGGALIGVAGAFQAPLFGTPPAIIQYILFNSLFLLAIPVVAGTDTIVGIGVVAVTFQILPFALEGRGLSTFLLGGIGLVAGTLIGQRGLGGTVLEIIQKKRDMILLTAASSEGRFAVADTDASNPSGASATVQTSASATGSGSTP